MRRVPIVLALGGTVATLLIACAVLLPSCVGGPSFQEEPQDRDGREGAGLQVPVEAGPVGRLPTVFPSCERQGEPVSYSRAVLGVRATWEVAHDLPGLAQEVLEQYGAQGDLMLHYADYLDLLGNVWACAVSGPSWAELVVIQDRGGDEVHAGSHSQDGPCLVSVMRLGEGAMGEDTGKDGGGAQ